MPDTAIQPFASLTIGSGVMIAAFTLLSGIGDAAGFIYASRVWSEGRFLWPEALKCIAGFQFGMLMYWLALWKLSAHGVVSVELQTLFWFVITIIGVAAFSGRILSWPAADQAVAGCLLLGIGWLMYRGAGA
jgi:hypothetical protein